MINWLLESRAKLLGYSIKGIFGRPLPFIALLLLAVTLGVYITQLSDPRLAILVAVLLVFSPIIIRQILKNPEWSFVFLAGGGFLWYLLPEGIEGLFQGYRTPLIISLVFLAHILSSTRARFSWDLHGLSLLEITLLLFTAFMALSIMWSNSRLYGAWKVGLFASTSVLIVMLIRRYYSLSPHHLANLVRVIAISAVIPIGIFIATAIEASGFKGLTSVWGYDVRLLISETSSLVGTANILMLSTPFILGAALMARMRWKKVLYYMLLFTCLYVLMLTGRRVAFVVAVMTVGLLFLSLDNQHRQFPARLVLIAIMIASSVWLVVVLNPARFIDRSIIDDISLINRLAAYTVSLNSFLHSPLAGTGIGGFGEAWYSVGIQSGAIINAGYSASAASPSLSRTFSHNLFMETLSELGTIGFFLLLIILYRIIQYLKSAWRITGTSSLNWSLRVVAAVGISAVCGLLLQAQFSGDLGTLSIGLWLGILVAVVEVSPESILPNNPALDLIDG